MRRILALTIMLTAACGIQPTGNTSAGEPPVAQARPEINTVYFVKGGALSPVTRPGLPGGPEFVVHQLLEGPTELERARGMTTSLSIRVEETQFGRDGGELSMTMTEMPSGLGLDQLVCTAATIPGVKRVRLASWDRQSLTHTCVSGRARPAE